MKKNHTFAPDTLAMLKNENRILIDTLNDENCRLDDFLDKVNEHIASQSERTKENMDHVFQLLFYMLTETFAAQPNHDKLQLVLVGSITAAHDGLSQQNNASLWRYSCGPDQSLTSLRHFLIGMLTTAHFHWGFFTAIENLVELTELRATWGQLCSHEITFGVSPTMTINSNLYSPLQLLIWLFEQTGPTQEGFSILKKALHTLARQADEAWTMVVRTTRRRPAIKQEYTLNDSIINTLILQNTSTQNFTRMNNFSKEDTLYANAIHETVLAFIFEMDKLPITKRIDVLNFALTLLNDSEGLAAVIVAQMVTSILASKPEETVQKGKAWILDTTFKSIAALIIAKHNVRDSSREKLLSVFINFLSHRHSDTGAYPIARGEINSLSFVKSLLLSFINAVQNPNEKRFDPVKTVVALSHLMRTVNEYKAKNGASKYNHWMEIAQNIRAIKLPLTRAFFEYVLQMPTTDRDALHQLMFEYLLDQTDNNEHNPLHNYLLFNCVDHKFKCIDTAIQVDTRMVDDLCHLIPIAFHQCNVDFNSMAIFELTDRLVLLIKRFDANAYVGEKKNAMKKAINKLITATYGGFKSADFLSWVNETEFFIELRDKLSQLVSDCAQHEGTKSIAKLITTLLLQQEKENQILLIKKEGKPKPKIKAVEKSTEVLFKAPMIDVHLKARFIPALAATNDAVTQCDVVPSNHANTQTACRTPARTVKTQTRFFPTPGDEAIVQTDALDDFTAIRLDPLSDAQLHVFIDFVSSGLLQHKLLLLQSLPSQQQADILNLWMSLFIRVVNARCLDESNPDVRSYFYSRFMKVGGINKHTIEVQAHVQSQLIVDAVYNYCVNPFHPYFQRQMELAMTHIDASIWRVTTLHDQGVAQYIAQCFASSGERFFSDVHETMLAFIAQFREPDRLANTRFFSPQPVMIKRQRPPIYNLPPRSM